ncbi:MAG: putative lipid phosphate phosphatase YodM [Frankiales bacterium]|jgi:membrane-associated phospholipid phosphatase|nr:putative lipid phosphate phosphatase YodM [Frankiales bacterium]
MMMAHIRRSGSSVCAIEMFGQLFGSCNGIPGKGSIRGWRGRPLWHTASMLFAILTGVGGALIVFLLVFLLFSLSGAPKRHNGGRPAAWALRLRATRTDSVARLGPIGAFTLFLGAGVFLTAAAGIALGEALSRLEGVVDRPTFHWVERVQDHDLAQLVETIGRMGNLPQTRGAGALAAIGLVLLARGRRWVPPLLIGSVIIVQKYAQTGLAKIVDRGHPPTTLGTYPSGGCARTVVIYGTIMFLLLFYARAGRRWQGAGWALIAMLAFIEGYTRTYLNKHWVTDVLGGWAFGLMLLVVVVFAGRALLPSRDGTAPEGPAPGQATGRTQPPVSSTSTTAATASCGVIADVSITNSASSGSS